MHTETIPQFSVIGKQNQEKFPDLWEYYDYLKSIKDDLEVEIDRVIKQLKTPPSERDMRICMRYLNGAKQQELADEWDISQPMIDKILRKGLPFAKKGLRSYGKSKL